LKIGALDGQSPRFEQRQGRPGGFTDLVQAGLLGEGDGTVDIAVGVGGEYT
jgi:hypothetical protein